MIKNIILKSLNILIFSFFLMGVINAANKIKIELQIGDEILTNIDFLIKLTLVFVKTLFFLILLLN